MSQRSLDELKAAGGVSVEPGFGVHAKAHLPMRLSLTPTELLGLNTTVGVRTKDDGIALYQLISVPNTSGDDELMFDLVTYRDAHVRARSSDE